MTYPMNLLQKKNIYILDTFAKYVGLYTVDRQNKPILLSTIKFYKYLKNF